MDLTPNTIVISVKKNILKTIINEIFKYVVNKYNFID